MTAWPQMLLLIIGIGPMFLELQLQVAYSQQGEEEVDPFSEKELAAEESLDKIFNSIQTQEGLDEFEKCGYVNGTGATKVLECINKQK